MTSPAAERIAHRQRLRAEASCRFERAHARARGRRDGAADVYRPPDDAVAAADYDAEFFEVWEPPAAPSFEARRQCLRCGVTFVSVGPQNRVCVDCHQYQPNAVWATWGMT